MNADQQMLLRIIQRLVETDIPLLYWVGYNDVLLVSAEHASDWTVTVSESPLVRVFPRRWLNIQGNKIPDYWHAALRAVIALVIFRPGISQVKISTFFLPPPPHVTDSLEGRNSMAPS